MNKEVMEQIPKRELEDMLLAIGYYLIATDGKLPPNSQRTRMRTMFNRVRNYLEGRYINYALERPVQ